VIVPSSHETVPRSVLPAIEEDGSVQADSVFIPLKTQNYILTVQNDSSCVANDTLTIEVFPKYGLSLGRDTSVIWDSPAIELHANGGTPGDFTTYEWQPKFYFAQGEFTTMPTNTALIDIQNNATYLNIIGTTKEGCIEQDTIVVMVVGNLVIPSGFTPNGDGINDVWEIGNAPDYGDRIEVHVLNRWGSTVYQSKGYDNTSRKFDGNRNGRPLPVGTYYYVITIKGLPSYKGTITIVR
jgi:gliding motility-associated-like protein